MQIDKAIETYLQWKSSYAPVAGDRYKVRLVHFQSYIGKSSNLQAIIGDHIVQYHHQMQAEGYSGATIAYSARILRNFFDFWKGRGESVLNPREIRPARYVPADKAVVEQDDFEDMCLTLDDGNLADLMKLMVIHLLWDTGMRLSELCDISLSDLQFKQEREGMFYIKVRSRKSMRYNLVVWGTKTNKLLSRYLGWRLDQDVVTDALLINPKANMNAGLHPRSIQRWVKQIAVDAGIDKNITPHSFRHAKAHYMLDKGANIRDVQAILRHVKPESTFHYMNLSPEKFIPVAGKYLNMV